jgi:hypothetical protein
MNKLPPPDEWARDKLRFVLRLALKRWLFEIELLTREAGL